MNHAKMKPMNPTCMNPLLLSRGTRVLAACVVALALSFRAQGAPPPANDNIYNYLQLLRSDFNSAKVKIIKRINDEFIRGFKGMLHIGVGFVMDDFLMSRSVEVSDAGH